LSSAPLRAAPDIAVGAWIQGGPNMPLAQWMSGHVVLLHAFQTLCPGCRRHGVPQAEAVARAVAGGSGTLAGAPLLVLGLHTPFDAHEPRDAAAVERFARELQLTHTIALDAAHDGDPDGFTATFRRFAMEGTPTLCLIDGTGRLRRRHLGPLGDLELGVELGWLLFELQTARAD